jgi:D-serine deaminase-like pyridoxal phosphate-dependent protein
MKADWFALSTPDEVSSPALLLYVDRIEENLDRMLHLAGGPARLRPHIKTHKLPELIQLHLSRGLTKFKCATIAEAEMAAAAGVPDILVAYQLVGPNVQRMVRLVRSFPGTSFRTIVDSPEALQALSIAFSEAKLALNVLLDLDCGQHRCGIAPGPEALALYRQIVAASGVKADGLHVYDGHIHDADPAARKATCDAAFKPIHEFAAELRRQNLPVPRIVAGGTPTFPIHAKNPQFECSPGTCVLWDAGYGQKMPDLDFLPSAALLTRVISKPGPNRLCLDLGHKAVASEMQPPRVLFPQIPDAKAVMHSEEHLVIETSTADQWPLGSELYGIPWHVCPTVNLHAEVVAVRAGQAVERWRVTGRERTLTI